MSEMVDWLLEQIAAEEQRAVAASAVSWEAAVPNMVHVVMDGTYGRKGLGYVASTDHQEHADYIAAWHPVRVLAECEAKRRIVTAYQDYCTRMDAAWADYCNWVDGKPTADTAPPSSSDDRGVKAGLEIALRLLALPYSDRPGYRAEWAPAPAKRA